MEMKSRLSSTTREYLMLASHIAVSAVIFLFLTLLAVGISTFGEFLVRSGFASSIMAHMFRWLEYFLLAVNVILFTVSIVSQMIRTIRRTTAHKDNAESRPLERTH
ncbi:MAG: hypothetical protein HOO98_13210 [Nitrospira sp.]|nr:hypothetical protein [Nitrospira sp.]